MSRLKHLLVQCICAQLHQYTPYTVLVSNDTLLNSHAHIYLQYALTESLCGAKPIVRYFYELLHFQVSNPHAQDPPHSSPYKPSGTLPFTHQDI